MIERVPPEMRLDTTVGRERFVFEFLIIDEFSLINEQPRERERVRRTGAVLRDDDRTRAVVERYDVFIIVRLDDRASKRLGRTATDNVMHAVDIAPAFPRGEQSRQRVGQTMFERRHHDAPCRAGHTLHITQSKRSGDAVRFAGASSCDNDRGVSTDKLRQPLRIIEVHLFLRHRHCHFV